MRHAAAIIACQAVLLACGGCQFVPKSRLTALESQNRLLAEQSKAQRAEIANLKAHARSIEDELARTAYGPTNREDRSQASDPAPSRPAKEVAPLQSQPAQLEPMRDSGRLTQLAQSYPDEIEHDPRTGAARFETPLPFAEGRAELEFETRQALVDVARLLRSAEGDQLRLLIVGHADRADHNRESAAPVSEDWRISTARALAIAEFLGKAGVPRERLGILGYSGGVAALAPSPAIASTSLPRQAELYLVERDAPVVGWQQSRQGLFR